MRKGALVRSGELLPLVYDELRRLATIRLAQESADQIYTYSYLFKYRLDAPGGAKTLTLPDNSRIRVVAVSLVQDENDATVATLPLYDDFNGRTAIQLSTN